MVTTFFFFFSFFSLFLNRSVSQFDELWGFLTKKIVLKSILLFHERLLIADVCVHLQNEVGKTVMEVECCGSDQMQVAISGHFLWCSGRPTSSKNLPDPVECPPLHT